VGETGDMTTEGRPVDIVGGDVADAAHVPVQRLNFSDPDERADHIRALFDWLPKEVRDVPFIDWELLPSQVIGYLTMTVGDSPDAAPIALATGSAQGAVGQMSLYGMCQGVSRLLRRLRSLNLMEHVGQLRDKDRWDAFVEASTRPPDGGRGTQRALPPGVAQELMRYDTLAAHHLRTYFDTLATFDPAQHAVLRAYALPPLPTSFWEGGSLRESYDAEARRRRKEQTDVLTPLHPFLVQIALVRKQAAEHLIKAVRAKQARVESGEVRLPHQFQIEMTNPVVTQDVCTHAEIDIIPTPVTLSFTLWDRYSWADAHSKDMSATQRSDYRSRQKAYAAARNHHFLQCHNPPDDLLWFGPLLAAHLIGAIWKGRPTHERRARLYVRRTGVLTAGASVTRWLRDNVGAGDVVFEPESLYRGVLYGTALATIALTSGARVSELLQVSDARWDLAEVEERRQGTPTGRRIRVVLQYLLPKGSKAEAQRQPYLISPQAVPLLTEISRALADRYGRVPIVHPVGNNKAEHLCPEPYLFQWDTSDNGQVGLLGIVDVGVLLRFMFHGLVLNTAKGTPIRIATHLCRHVFATSARYTYGVPLEAIAWMLHHRAVRLGEAQPLSISEATHYYSESKDMQLALLHEAQMEMSNPSSLYALQLPTEQDLEDMDEELRAVFENWGTIGPTVLGFCKAGMCIRPNNRAQCVGCPFLVEDYRRLGNARRWRKIYARDAEMLEEDGHMIEAMHKRREIEHLDAHINAMRLQMKVLQSGAQLPVFLSLPLPEEDPDDEVNDA